MDNDNGLKVSNTEDSKQAQNNTANVSSSSEQQTKNNSTNDTSSDIDIQRQLAETQAKSEEYLAGWKRAQADFENYRKRTDSEMAEWVAFGKQTAFVQIVPILDSLEQALSHAPEIEDQKYINWNSGLDGIIKQMQSIMKQLGIEKIEALGEKFDPNLHEAVKEIPGEDDGIVAEQYQAGYTLNGKLLRPAQVVITKKKESE